MAGIRIVTDSSCDLPADLVAKHSIEVVPLTVRFGEEEFVDRVDLTPEQFWARIASSPVLPETAAPAPGMFEAAYRRAHAEGCTGVVAIALSGELSATYQSAELAATAVKDTIDVRVIDSRALTLALGLMVITAAEAAEAGASIDDVVAAVNDVIPRTKIYAALDTLENLKKGGRIGGAQALVGSMLSIKPIIEIAEGKVEQESRQRTRSKSLRYLAEKVRDAGPITSLAVVHGNAPDVEEMLDLLAPIYPREQIIVSDLGAVIGTHGGPRTMGITFQVAAR